MSSDDAYSSFLDQANQDTGASKASTQSKSKSVSTKAVDTDVPATLQKVEQYYTSEADEPFEPVSLRWNGKNMPSESTYAKTFILPRCSKHELMQEYAADEFGELIGVQSEVSTLGSKEFDPQGQYKEVLQVVEKAGDGKARVFKIETGRARAEYYVVGFDEKNGRVVGLKAKSVES